MTQPQLLDFTFIAHTSHAGTKYSVPAGDNRPATEWPWGVFRKIPHGGIVFIGTAAAALERTDPELLAILADLNADPARFQKEQWFEIVPMAATANQTCPTRGLGVPVFRDAAWGLSGFGPQPILLSIAQAEATCPQLVEMMRSHGHLPPAEPPPETDEQRTQRQRAEALRRRQEKIEAESERCQKLNDRDEADAIEIIAELFPRVRASVDAASDREIARDLVGALLLMVDVRDYRGVQSRPRRKRK